MADIVLVYTTLHSKALFYIADFMLLRSISQISCYFAGIVLPHS